MLFVKHGMILASVQMTNGELSSESRKASAVDCKNKSTYRLGSVLHELFNIFQKIFVFKSFVILAVTFRDCPSG